jgi:hypothetical protein
MAKPITVSIVGNAGPLRKSLEEADGIMGRFGGSIQKLGIAAAAGVGSLAAGIGFAAKAAADDQKSFEQMAQTLRNVTTATDDQIRALDEQLGAMSLATGVADDQLRPAFEALARGTKDTETAMENMNLVLDISTALQMDQTAVADALAKAMQGNTKALKSLSPEMAAMIKDGASLDEVMSVLSETFGGSATVAANTFSGQVSRLKVFASELVEQLGYYVLPVLSKMAEFIVNDVVPAFGKIVDKYGPMLADVFEKIATFISEKVVPVMRDRLIPFISQVAEFIGERLVPVIRDVAIVVFGKLRDIFEVVSQKIEDNRDKIENIISFFRALADFVTTYVAPVLVKVLGKAFDVVAIAIGPVIDVVFSLMDAFASLGKFLLKVAGFVVEAFEAMVNTIIDGVNFAIRALNLLPGVDIGELGKVSFSLPSLGAAPSAPSGPNTAPSAGRYDPDFPSIAPTPTVVVPTIPTVTPGGGTSSGGGGGKGAAPIRILPVDMEGQIPIIGGIPEFGGGGGGGFGAAPGNEALLDGLTGGVSITVNTVSADANLPNLIVDALQRYNLTSGPIDVTIAA